MICPMITPSGRRPGRVTQLFPAESLRTGRPSSDFTLAVNHDLALRQTGPQATRCAPSGVEVSLAKSFKSLMTCLESSGGSFPEAIERIIYDASGPKSTAVGADGGAS